MRKFIFLLVFSLIVSSLFIFNNCQSSAIPPDGKDKESHVTKPMWPKRLGGTGQDGGKCIKIDKNGNIFLTGFITGDVDLNGDGDTSDAGGESGANYGLSDVFIDKFSSTGTWQWFKRLGWTSSDSGHSIAIDLSSDIVVAGSVLGNVDLDSNGIANEGGAESTPGIFNFSDAFCKRFRGMNNALMGIRLGGTEGDSGRGITVDASNDNIVTGYICGDADLNWSAGTVTSGLPEKASAAYGNNDVFISKFDSSLQNWKWALRLGGTDMDYGMAVASDKDNNIIVVGYVTGTADFNGNGSTDDIPEESGSYGGSDVMLCKFDKTGTLAWGLRLGGAGKDEGYGACTDSSGNIFVAGLVTGAADLNGDGDTLDTDYGESNTGFLYDDIFVAKFNPSGTCLWAKRLGGAGYDAGYGITVDGSGNVIITGIILGDADLNGDGDILDSGESSAGYSSYDVFIAKFDTSGTGLWTKRLGGLDADYGYSVAADSSGNVYATGIVNGASDLNGDGDSADGSKETSGLGMNDIFIVKFSPGGLPLSM